MFTSVFDLRRVRPTAQRIDGPLRASGGMPYHVHPGPLADRPVTPLRRHSSRSDAPGPGRAEMLLSLPPGLDDPVGGRSERMRAPHCIAGKTGSR